MARKWDKNAQILFVFSFFNFLLLFFLPPLLHVVNTIMAAQREVKNSKKSNQTS
jgi:hypothetical protein